MDVRRRDDRLKELAEAQYARFNRREYALRDPVSFTYRYRDPLDAEVAGLVAALLAYGRLAQIMRAALEVTGGFRTICPQDPVRYDFCLMHASAAGELPTRTS